MRPVVPKLPGNLDLRRPLAAFAEPERSMIDAARTWYEETLLRASSRASADDTGTSPDGGSTA